MSSVGTPCRWTGQAHLRAHRYQSSCARSPWGANHKGRCHHTPRHGLAMVSQSTLRHILRHCLLPCPYTIPVGWRKEAALARVCASGMCIGCGGGCGGLWQGCGGGVEGTWWGCRGDVAGGWRGLSSIAWDSMLHGGKRRWIHSTWALLSLVMIW